MHYGLTALVDGGYVEDPRLDRVPSETTEHFEKYPLTAETMPSIPTSMVLGVNWYENFDNPVRATIHGSSRYVIGRGALGRVRGGHAICARNWNITDQKSWWKFYDQGSEGRCVEFATLRVMTQLNRKRYDITSRWHYHTYQHLDEWIGCFLGHENATYEGTSVRAGLAGLKKYGAIPARFLGASINLQDGDRLVEVDEGIAAYRWALNWNDVRQVLAVPDWLPGIPINNSWGTGYPREVILLDEAGEALLHERGEFGIVTDR